jgi:hypothetical protein
LGLQEPRLCGEQAAHRRRLLQPREVNLQLADVPAREAALDLRPNPLGQHDTSLARATSASASMTSIIPRRAAAATSSRRCVSFGLGGLKPSPRGLGGGAALP